MHIITLPSLSNRGRPMHHPHTWHHNSHITACTKIFALLLVFWYRYLACHERHSPHILLPTTDRSLPRSNFCSNFDLPLFIQWAAPVVLSLQVVWIWDFTICYWLPRTLLFLIWALCNSLSLCLVRVLCNPLFICLGTMQPVILYLFTMQPVILSFICIFYGYYATRSILFGYYVTP